MGKKGGNNKKRTPGLREEDQESSTFSNIGKKIEGIGKKIEEVSETLKYKLPNTNSIVGLFGRKEELEEMIKQNNFIDENNFRLQIGKMQEDGNTIYSPLMLSFGIDYIIDHIKLDENGEGKAIIQLWPDLAQILLQNNDNINGNKESKEILSFEKEKEKIEKLIRKKFKKKLKKKFGKKREDAIEIQNVANNYSDVFSAIKDNGKEGIIPKKEPKLEAPLKSPLPIIEYLAYHCVNDEKDKNGASKLMNLFYETKPIKYRNQDGKNYIPGTSNADYYAVVEVGIRLYEILNGITIQGGIGRQRVYDRIISLILFGEDRIGTSKDYDITTALNLKNHLSLSKLHDWINGNYKDIKMQQLYIDLNEKSHNKIKENVEKKENCKSKIIRGLTGLALFSALTFGGIKIINTTIQHKKQLEIDYTYAERKSKQPSSYEQTLYPQETNELIMALSLDELENNNKEIIIELFNMYIKKHKTSQSTIAELINQFYLEYGGTLIKKFGLTHYPYDFVNNNIMTSELINNTKGINQDVPIYPNRYYGNNLIGSEGFRYSYGKYQIDRFKDPFEYNDGGKKYIILPVKIGDIGNTTKWIYLAQEKHSKKGEKNYTLSTYKINEIQDKTGLDKAIISNTNNLKGNFTTNCTFIYGFNRIHIPEYSFPRKIRNDDPNQVIDLENGRRSEVNTVYSENSGFNYIITLQTQSGEYAGLASKSKYGPYSIPFFNEIANDFYEKRN